MFSDESKITNQEPDNQIMEVRWIDPWDKEGKDKEGKDKDSKDKHDYGSKP